MTVMHDVPQRRSAINIVVLGTALSAALVVLFVFCVLAALIFPGVPLAYGWVALFSVQPMGSAGKLDRGDDWQHCIRLDRRCRPRWFTTQWIARRLHAPIQAEH